MLYLITDGIYSDRGVRYVVERAQPVTADERAKIQAAFDDHRRAFQARMDADTPDAWKLDRDTERAEWCAILCERFGFVRVEWADMHEGKVSQ